MDSESWHGKRSMRLCGLHAPRDAVMPRTVRCIALLAERPAAYRSVGKKRETSGGSDSKYSDTSGFSSLRIRSRHWLGEAPWMR